MFKKILPIVLSICLLSVAGCSKNPESLSVDRGSEPAPVVSEPVEEEVILNPLTGLADITKQESENRPVAVMINNISIYFNKFYIIAIINRNNLSFIYKGYSFHCMFPWNKN